MPHLSPMQWILALLSMWTMLLLISATYWWSQPSSFHSTASKVKDTMQSKWSWL